MRKFETNKELRGALEKALREKMNDSLFRECAAGWNPPYDETDFREILEMARSKTRKGRQRDARVRKSPHGMIPEVVRAIAAEVCLWQEVRLHQIEPQLVKARTRLLGSSGVMDAGPAQEFAGRFFNREGMTIRPAYMALFLERRVLRRDYGAFLETMQPSDDEYFLAVVAMVMNTAYLSGTEAICYILTGRRLIVPGLFNPTNVLMAYRLALYLQPPGRPSRSLLSERELGLLRLVGTAPGNAKWADLWAQWNHEHPEWCYDSWRMFRKAHQLARRRLLNSYSMAFALEHKETEGGPEALWQWLEEATAKALGQT